MIADRSISPLCRYRSKALRIGFGSRSYASTWRAAKTLGGAPPLSRLVGYRIIWAVLNRCLRMIRHRRGYAKSWLPSVVRIRTRILDGPNRTDYGGRHNLPVSLKRIVQKLSLARHLQI